MRAAADVAAGCRRVHRMLGAGLHAAPDARRLQGARTDLDQRVGGEVGQVPRQGAAAPLRAAEQLADGLEKAGFPDEVDRVDMVALPPVDVLVGDLQAARFGHQPAMRIEHQAQLVARRQFADRLRQVLLEDRVDVPGRRGRLALA